MAETRRLSYREESRTDWRSPGEGTPTTEDIRLGALLRMADATEKMAGNFAAMERDLRYYKDAYRDSQASLVCECRRSAALRGWITRLRRQGQ